MKHNRSCSTLQMISDPLLKEKVCQIIAFTQYWWLYLTTPLMGWLTFQSFGIAEGRPIKDLKEMAKEAGQSFLSFTPPEGETQDQVSPPCWLHSKNCFSHIYLAKCIHYFVRKGYLLSRPRLPGGNKMLYCFLFWHILHLVQIKCDSYCLWQTLFKWNKDNMKVSHITYREFLHNTAATWRHEDKP